MLPLPRRALLTIAACDSSPAPAPLTPTAPATAPARPSSLITARPYTMRAPASHAATAPLLVLLHGYGSDHANVATHLGIAPLADSHGFYVALPDGTPDRDGARFWNASDACCDFDDLAVDDVAYLDAILDDALARYPIDPARIYVAGFSNGGFMAHRYACDRASRVTAVVSFAGEPWKDATKCVPTIPVSVLQVQGDADEVVLYGGGRPSDGRLRGAKFARAGVFPGAREAAAMWGTKDGCPEPSRTDDPREETLRYGPCKEGSAVELWTRHGERHVLSWSPADGERMWTFLAAHTRR